MIALTMSVIVCIIVIMSIWTKWTDHPVIVTFDDRTTSIAKIPFPAVTICPTKKFLNDQVDVGKLKATLEEMDSDPKNGSNRVTE